jgi:hypothetical protein
MKEDVEQIVSVVGYSYLVRAPIKDCSTIIYLVSTALRETGIKCMWIYN